MQRDQIARNVHSVFMQWPFIAPKLAQCASGRLRKTAHDPAMHQCDFETVEHLLENKVIVHLNGQQLGSAFGRFAVVILFGVQWV